MNQKQQQHLCKVNSLLKPRSQYLAALADWFVLSRDIKRIRKNGNNENCVRIFNHKVMGNIFNVQCDVLEQKII